MHDFILTNSNYINYHIIGALFTIGLSCLFVSIMPFSVSFVADDKFGKNIFRLLGSIVLIIGLFFVIILPYTPIKNLFKTNLYTGIFKVANNPEIDNIQNEDNMNATKNDITIQIKDEDNNYQKFLIKNTKENRKFKKGDIIQINIINKNKPSFDKTNLSSENIVSTKKIK